MSDPFLPSAWEKPGPAKTRRGRSVWDPAAEQLKASPGEWAMFENPNASAVAANMRKGEVPSFRPPSDWEFTSRDGNRLYIRYVGGGGA